MKNTTEIVQEKAISILLHHVRYSRTHLLHTYSPVTIYENIWQYMRIYENMWEYMRIYENIWEHMKDTTEIVQEKAISILLHHVRYSPPTHLFSCDTPPTHLVSCDNILLHHVRWSPPTHLFSRENKCMKPANHTIHTYSHILTPYTPVV